MARRQRKQMEPAAIGLLCTLFFGVFTLAMFATSEHSGDPLGYGLGILGLSLTLFSTGLFALGPKNEKGVKPPTKVGWVIFVVAATLLAASPFVLNAVGVGWGNMMGRRSYRNMPLWMFAVICWAGAVGVYYAAVRTALQARRRSRS